MQLVFAPFPFSSAICTHLNILTLTVSNLANHFSTIGFSFTLPTRNSWRHSFSFLPKKKRKIPSRAAAAGSSQLCCANAKTRKMTAATALAGGSA
jgi:hypothetical protein